MRGKYILLISVFLFLIAKISFSQKINIGILTNHNVKSFIFSTIEGRYQISGDKKHTIAINKKSVLNFQVNDTSIIVKDLNSFIGNFKYIEITGLSKDNVFEIQSLVPKIKAKAYEDGLILFPNNGFIRVINKADLEHYISGVVESEAGSRSSLEYYKTQAIITRTYALKNFHRHSDEGYNLCSEVHCQAYHNKAHISDKILKAVKFTRGLIIVDTTLNLITATFHSNSGGQTIASEMVWLTAKSYLKSVTDTFSLNKTNTTWTKTIPLWKWRTYLKQNGFVLPVNNISKHYLYSQPQRRMYYTFNGDSMLLKSIRADFGLRSTFFSTSLNGNNIILDGRGYGHGVGLSQQGAMEMAETGYNYRKIIKFYYKNVFIVSLRALQFFKNEEE